MNKNEREKINSLPRGTRERERAKRKHSKKIEMYCSQLTTIKSTSLIHT
jgi:hypothetical protein